VSRAKRKPGRPPLDVSRSENVLLRVTADERKRWRDAADRADQTLSEWLRAAAEGALR